MTDVLLTGRQVQVEQESVGTVFSSLTAAQGYAEMVLEQVQTAAMADVVVATVVRLQVALQEHERRMRIACGLSDGVLLSVGPV